ncbi:peptidase, M23/M37 family protein [Catenovulum agarivorans DS-2]|uniref:Peptidase, M23/M37 family protein n=1 Tax=Catenovulum agarivorans DS-2 TaxID=1328313 RepID=W7QHG9_9ALTE|nr:M23 family metallopeptidase [Catenovulum agarivorans]EWH11326.1 peptidase, M23/M37 family protein [Catenovulum agarivorans DS-2]
MRYFRLIFAFITIIVTSLPLAALASYVVESQALAQGGFIKGKFNGCVEVTVVDGDKKYVGKCTPQGNFLVGFGRDAQVVQKIIFSFADKQDYMAVVELEQRQYKTDRVNGVPQKTVSPPKEVLDRIKGENEQIWLARNKHTDSFDFLSEFIWPAKGRISGVYGSQRIFNGVPKRPHFGLDVAAPKGTPVVAPASGIIRLAHKDMFYSGGTIILDHGYGITSTFIHLSKLDVIEGQQVKQGEKIGEIGKSGRATGNHLDWRINWKNVRLDPAFWVKAGGNE